MWMTILGALLIFLLRIGDVSIGTIRTMYAVRGHRWTSAILGFFESAIFIFAVSSVLAGAKEPIKMIAYAMGFAVGTLVGVTVEKWIGSGWTLIRIISKSRSDEITATLRAADFGVTRMTGEGRDGTVCILIIVAPRRRSDDVVQSVQKLDDDAFVTLEPVGKAVGGYLPRSGDVNWMTK
jgi:uncharacterized protein YebE (UPF0316 family)